jgi:hypothetical protein
LQVAINTTNVFGASVAVPICQSGGAVDLSGRTISMMVRFEGATNFNVLNLMRAFAWSATGEDSCNLNWGTQMNLAIGSWQPMSCMFTTSVQTNHFAIDTGVNGDPWIGTMYLDNITIN